MNQSRKKTTTASPKKKGRPARLSREQILKAALKLLVTTDAKDLTLTAIAKSLDTVPMSLYNHVADLDDIFEGAAELVLAEMNLEVDSQASWQDQLHQWMSELQAHLGKYPQAIKIFGQQNQVTGAWMSALTPVIRMFRQEGLEGKQLVMATSWVAETCASLIQIQSAAAIDQQRVNLSRLQGLPEADQQELFFFMTQFGELSADEYFDYIKERMIDSLSRILISS